MDNIFWEPLKRSITNTRREESGIDSPGSGQATGVIEDKRDDPMS